MGGLKVSVRALLSEPSPSDWERLEGLLLDGCMDPKSAADELGFTLSAFRRQDSDRQRALLAASREARADAADQRLEHWALDPDASDQVRLYWHRYHATAAGRMAEKVAVEHSGNVVVEHERRLTLGDLADFARELERRGDGARGELPAAGEILPAPSDG